MRCGPCPPARTRTAPRPGTHPVGGLPGSTSAEVTTLPTAPARTAIARTTAVLREAASIGYAPPAMPSTRVPRNGRDDPIPLAMPDGQPAGSTSPESEAQT